MNIKAIRHNHFFCLSITSCQNLSIGLKLQHYCTFIKVSIFAKARKKGPTTQRRYTKSHNKQKLKMWKKDHRHDLTQIVFEKYT